MSVVAYPAYKDSGVRWIGRVPASWNVLPFKRLARLCTERAEGRTFPVALENIEGWSGRRIETDATYEGEGIAFNSGDILFGKLRPYLAKAWVADRCGEAVGDFHVIRSFGGHRAEYLQRVLLTQEVISLIDGSTYGAKMPRASWDFMGMLPVPVPPADEQTAIATFLDRETGKIDTLVAEQERLIALLKEKRQAVISQAVTKGLNPDVPMKPSGVEWLGDIPKHWQIKPLKRVTSFVSGGTPSKEREDYWAGDIPWVSPKDMKTWIVSGHSDGITMEAVASARLVMIQENAVLVVVRGMILAHSFPVAVAGRPLTINQDMKALLTPSAQAARFLAYALSATTERVFEFIDEAGHGTRALRMEGFANMKLAFPNIEEQTQIVEFIECETARLDKLITEAARAVILLKERRAALISAAVTGKIDVRNLVQPSAEQAFAA